MSRHKPQQTVSKKKFVNTVSRWMWMRAALAVAFLILAFLLWLPVQYGAAELALFSFPAAGLSVTFFLMFLGARQQLRAARDRRSFSNTPWLDHVERRFRSNQDVTDRTTPDSARPMDSP